MLPIAVPVRACARRLATTIGLTTLVGLLGCSALGEGAEGGGASNLPNRGVAGYDLLDNGDDGDHSWLGLRDRIDGVLEIRSPAAIVRDDRVLLFFEGRSVQDDGAPDVWQVFRAESSDGTTFSDPAAVGGLPLRARCREPSLLELDGELVMLYAGRDASSLRAATSTDGLVFAPLDAPLLEASGAGEAGGIDAPTGVVDDDGQLVVLYAARRAGDEPRTTIRRAVGSLDGLARDGVALAPGTGCVDPQGEPTTCWDAALVTDPDLQLSTTSLGRRMWRLAYAGGDDDAATALGFAFSYDGHTWSRYPYNPSIDRLGSELRAPSHVRFGDAFLLYLDEAIDGDTSIAVAISDAGQPSETF